jgi:hypothetical protein
MQVVVTQQKLETRDKLLLVFKHYLTTWSNEVILILRRWWMYDYGTLVKWYWPAKTEVLEEKPVRVSLCLPENLHVLAWNWNRASAVRRWWRTAWAMTRLHYFVAFWMLLSVRRTIPVDRYELYAVPGICSEAEDRCELHAVPGMSSETEDRCELHAMPGMCSEAEDRCELHAVPGMCTEAEGGHFDESILDS